MSEIAGIKRHWKYGAKEPAGSHFLYKWRITMWQYSHPYSASDWIVPAHPSALQVTAYKSTTSITSMFPLHYLCHQTRNAFWKCDLFNDMHEDLGELRYLASPLYSATERLIETYL